MNGFASLGVNGEEHRLKPVPLRPTRENSLRLAEAAATADASVAEEVSWEFSMTLRTRDVVSTVCPVEIVLQIPPARGLLCHE